MKLGFLALGRATFDVDFANKKLTQCLEKLNKTNHQLYGCNNLLLEESDTLSEIKKLKKINLDKILVLQITFTDAVIISKLSKDFKIPILIWSVPEPRLGGRLRLNSFCGLNLASHSLSITKKSFSWIYNDPQKIDDKDLNKFLKNNKNLIKLTAKIKKKNVSNDVKIIQTKVNSFNITKIGNHPDGFETCSYDPELLSKRFGININEIGLNILFDKSKKIEIQKMNEAKKNLKNSIVNLENLNKKETDLSIKLKLALDNVQKEYNTDGFAIRCWPEMFTEYGAAICAPAAMMGENNIPCACEADVYGSLTQLILQEISKSSVFLTDIVDVDVTDNTAVVWHCGQAPISMAPKNSKPKATIHTNRKKPLLFEFPLKPGKITMMRISKSFNEHKMVISTGEMLKRKMAFTGTSGVVKFEKSAEIFLNNLINSGLEHHMALCYGDHREKLEELAFSLKLPILYI